LLLIKKEMASKNDAVDLTSEEEDQDEIDYERGEGYYDMSRYDPSAPAKDKPLPSDQEIEEGKWFDLIEDMYWNIQTVVSHHIGGQWIIGFDMERELLYEVASRMYTFIDKKDRINNVPVRRALAYYGCMIVERLCDIFFHTVSTSDTESMDKKSRVSEMKELVKSVMPMFKDGSISTVIRNTENMKWWLGETNRTGGDTDVWDVLYKNLIYKGDEEIDSDDPPTDADEEGYKRRKVAAKTSNAKVCHMCGKYKQPI